MAVPRSRILDLMKVQCRIFAASFNPQGLRTGNKVLRQRLKGPAMAAYYPRRPAGIRDLRKLFPQLETWDEHEEERLESLQIAKSKGKGHPKKKRTANTSRRKK
ncbi:MAG: hypothetical protein M1823_004609 [Watsoniomyces obsoletus]|nr:MAG: hypothetical protein M1823_004609 [Watsoniomyces obsoletus]